MLFGWKAIERYAIPCMILYWYVTSSQCMIIITLQEYDEIANVIDYHPLTKKASYEVLPDVSMLCGNHTVYVSHIAHCLHLSHSLHTAHCLRLSYFLRHSTQHTVSHIC